LRNVVPGKGEGEDTEQDGGGEQGIDGRRSIVDVDSLVRFAHRSRYSMAAILGPLPAAAKAEPATRGSDDRGATFVLVGLFGLAFVLETLFGVLFELVFARLELVGRKRLSWVLIAVRHALASLLCWRPPSPAHPVWAPLVS